MKHKFAQEILDALPDLSAVHPDIQRLAKLGGVEDSAETLVFARMLEVVKSRVYQIKTTALKGATFVPVSFDAGPNAKFLTYKVWEGYSMARLVTNYATDFELVNASARESFIRFWTFGNAYNYSLEDLQMAAAAGEPLSTRLAEQARRGHDLAMDEAIAIGIPEVGTYGLTNHPNIQLLSLPNGDWTNASTTAQDILDDLNSILTQQMVDTLELHYADTILMSTEAYRLISTKLMDATSERTVLQVFLAQNPGVQVASWTKLATASADGTNGRIVAYKRDPEVMEFEMSQGFQVYAPEQRALMIIHACTSRIGGLVLHIPPACAYADNQLV